MHDNQLREDGLAKHEFLIQNATDWRRTRNLPATRRPAPSAVRRLQANWAAVVNLLIGH